MAPTIPADDAYPVGAKDFDFYASGEITPQSHVVGRLYYPAADGAPRSLLPITWIRHPAYAYGTATFAFFLASTLKQKVMKWVITLVMYAVGSLRWLPLRFNAPLARTPRAVPVVVFSHGATSMRNTYSNVCMHLASKGYLVVAVEHADGSAASCQLATGRHRLFAGLGKGAVLEAKGAYRAEEVATLVDLLQHLNEGRCPEGFRMSGPEPPGAAFAGRLDLQRLAVAGHSCGATTAADVASRDARVKAAVCLDPWWNILPSDSPALHRWKTSTPLLVVGSQEWNTPGVDGDITGGGARQSAVLQAAAASGGGYILWVPRHTTHHSFSDVPAMVDTGLVRALSAVAGVKPSKTPPAVLMAQINWAVSTFLAHHLRLPSGGQGTGPGALSPEGPDTRRSSSASWGSASGGGCVEPLSVSAAEVEQWKEEAGPLAVIFQARM